MALLSVSNWQASSEIIVLPKAFSDAIQQAVVK